MFRKFLRFILVLLLLVAAVGFYGWYDLGNSIDAANSKLPYGFRLSYDMRYIDHEGVLTLTKPTLKHRDGGTTLIADKLTYHPNSWKDYLGLGNNITIDIYPEKGEIRLENLSIPLSSLATTFNGPSDIKFLKLLAQGCRDKQDFTLQDLVNTGVNEASGQFKLLFEFDRIAHSLKLDTSVRLKKLVSFESRLELNDFIPGTDNSPYLAFGQWIMYEPEVIHLRDKYCAQLNKQTEDEFKSQHIEAFVHFLQQKGIVLNDQFVKRYQEFVKKPENMAFTFSPETGIRFNKFNQLKFSEITNLLGIRLNINGRAVPSIVAAVDMKQVKKDEEAANPKPETIEGPKVYRNPSVSRLSSFGDKVVILTLDGEKEYEGKILSVNQRRVKFQVRSFGGYAELYFEVNEIKSVQQKP